VKKISLFLISIMFLSSFAFATEEIEHSTIRHLVGSGFNLTEVNENTVTGTFKAMSVYLAKNGKDEKPGYTGWVVKGEKKLPLSISYKDKKMHGDFNGSKFSYDSMDIKKKLYNFKTDTGKTKVSYMYETKEGRHQVNPLFIAKNNKRNYLVRLKGECCIGHGLSYAAIIYGLTTFDDVAKVTKKKEDKH
jgi:hypothetical protein